jgi:hypothetical protein
MASFRNWLIRVHFIDLQKYFFPVMMLIRIVLLAFNVALVTFLIYRLLQIYKSSDDKKGWKMGIGIFLLLVPVIMILGFVKPTPVYMLLYPVAISLHLYLIRNS